MKDYKERISVTVDHSIREATIAMAIREKRTHSNMVSFLLELALKEMKKPSRPSK